MQAAHAKRYKFVPYEELDLSKGIYLFTDGSTENNGRKDPSRPCLGGYGWIVVRDGVEIARGSGGAVDTSISRMELSGVVEALRWGRDNLDQGTAVTVVSDSQYVVRGACEWLRGWLKRDWTNNEGKPTPNQDLWKPLIRLSNASEVLSYGSKLDVRWSWVKGHEGHAWNEACDVLAGEERDRLVRESRTKTREIVDGLDAELRSVEMGST